MKKNKNFILEEDETYKNIADEIFKSYNIDCYTKYVNDFCSNRLLTKKKKAIYCFHPPCFNKVIDDNYCSNHQDENIIFKIFI